MREPPTDELAQGHRFTPVVLAIYMTACNPPGDQRLESGLPAWPDRQQSDIVSFDCSRETGVGLSDVAIIVSLELFDRKIPPAMSPFTASLGSTTAFFPLVRS